VDDRQRLLLGIAALCDASPPSGELSPVLAEIFLVLARQAERDVRKILSERLAKADWAPAALVNVLALDEIEIARPIIAASPILRDEDLMRVLLEATIEHQIEVARRPRLSGRVADAIIHRAEPAPLPAPPGHPPHATQNGGPPPPPPAPPPPGPAAGACAPGWSIRAASPPCARP